MLQVLIEFLNEQKWQFTQVPDKNVLFLGVSGNNGNLQCVADINEKDFKFVFFSVCGTNVPPNKRKEISELLTRLNLSQFLGNFEMNFDNGEIRFKTSFHYKDIAPTVEFITPYIMVNISVMDICLPSIMAVIFGDSTPEEAQKIVEETIKS